MSAWWSEAAGSLFIVAGVKLTWDDVRRLVPLTARRSQPARAERKARRKALTALRYSLFYIAYGAMWIVGLNTHPVIGWLLLAYFGLLLVYDLVVWSRSRKRAESGGETA